MKEISVQVDKRKVVLKADRRLFARMVVVAQSQLLNLKEVFSNEFGPLPWSLATMDGSPVKTQKSKLLQLIEKHSPEVADNIPMGGAAVLIDAMALLQSLQSPGETFR